MKLFKSKNWTQTALISSGYDVCDMLRGMATDEFDEEMANFIEHLIEQYETNINL